MTRRWPLLVLGLVAGVTATMAIQSYRAATPSLDASLTNHVDDEGPDGHADEAGHIEISDEALVGAGIEVVAAAGGAIAPTISLPGEIVLPPNGHIVVSARTAGVLTEMLVGIGQTVSAGDVIGTIDSPALAHALAAHASALARLEFAAATRDREADLAARRITARQDLELAEQALTVARADVAGTGEALRGLGLDERVVSRLTSEPDVAAELPVLAPARGIVTEQSAAPGETVEAGTPLVTLTDAREVWVHVQVHARDLEDVRPGRPVTVQAVGISRVGSGTVATVSPVVGDDTRTATARVVLSNSDGRWHPGLFVTVGVALEAVPAEVVVPVDSVQTFEGGAVVFVREGFAFEARPVELGRSDGRQVEIASGLGVGERYAAVNAHVVKADMLKGGASHGH